jgi:hypothetical protein
MDVEATMAIRQAEAAAEAMLDRTAVQFDLTPLRPAAEGAVARARWSGGWWTSAGSSRNGGKASHQERKAPVCFYRAVSPKSYALWFNGVASRTSGHRELCTSAGESPAEPSETGQHHTSD